VVSTQFETALTDQPTQESRVILTEILACAGDHDAS
jgi:hypothetical protein